MPSGTSRRGYCGAGSIGASDFSRRKSRPWGATSSCSPRSAFFCSGCPDFAARYRPSRRFIKRQKYNLLSRHENLTLEGKRSLKILLATNRRLNTAYVLKEAFGQLWDYGREGWARRFFDNWRASLKWQRLGPYERFAEMIDRHWDGIAAYCKPENKVSLGFVEGLNNKIRVFQRRAYGLRDDEYLRLKVLTCMLPPL